MYDFKNKFTFAFFITLSIIILSIIIHFYSRGATLMTVLFSFIALIFGIPGSIFQIKILKNIATISIILAFIGLASFG